MREFLSIIFLSALQVTSMLLAGIAGAFNAAGQTLHVYFVHKATQHQIKHGPREEPEQPVKVLAPAKNPKELN